MQTNLMLAYVIMSSVSVTYSLVHGNYSDLVEYLLYFRVWYCSCSSFSFSFLRDRFVTANC